MPSFFKPRSGGKNADEKNGYNVKDKDKETKKAAVTRPADAAEAHDGPPAYSVQDTQSQAQGNNDAGAAPAPHTIIRPDQLSVTEKAPNVDTCLAHLRFLYALHALKEEIGYTDGLWGLADERAFDDSIEPRVSEGQRQPTTKEERTQARLALVREKRWALFVARAVDRYEVWWKTTIADTGHGALHELDVEDKEPGPKYAAFPTASRPQVWTEAMMPPLDVLMVLHTHMLNPRDFLEDCMRDGLPGLWAAGFPWQLVNRYIAPDFSFNAPEATQLDWCARTARHWDNTDDRMVKEVRCPACQAQVDVPWTACDGGGGAEKGGGKKKKPRVMTEELTGTGYGDAGFLAECMACHIVVDASLLSVGKFVDDVKQLLSRRKPMPGTILRAKSGCPEIIDDERTEPRTFPNRVVRSAIGEASLQLIKRPLLASDDSTAGSYYFIRPSMETVRDMIEKVLRDNVKLADIESFHRPFVRPRLPIASRLAIRKMMSRYWNNCSPFALELGGAVLRQGVFIDKMHQIDWLHSPAARDTMGRLITKYERFIQLMAECSGEMLVPTLDVDLAWHTHQLSPQSYYDFSYTKTAKARMMSKVSSETTGGKFIDHDDKIDEAASPAAARPTARRTSRRTMPSPPTTPTACSPT